jgi:threonine/homoserine/homoserine lactone efflux protein
MQQFLLVAAAHFLALLSPGPDFFLIARTSVHEGWRAASGACLGIACANAVFIVAAFAGISALRPDGAPFIALQLAGAVYLLYLGVRFLRHAGAGGLDQGVLGVGSNGGTTRRAASMGFLSGILNPKNALFYVSLASMLGSIPLGGKVFYGAWMFSVVLAWDMLVAALIGNPLLLRRFSRALPWIERTSGGVLVLLALGVLAHLLRSR